MKPKTTVNFLFIKSYFAFFFEEKYKSVMHFSAWGKSGEYS